MDKVEWWRPENPDPEIAEIEARALFEALAEGASDLEEAPGEDNLAMLALLLDTVLRAADAAETDGMDGDA